MARSLKNNSLTYSKGLSMMNEGREPVNDYVSIFDVGLLFGWQ
jgi:hypothetical protein